MKLRRGQPYPDRVTSESNFLTYRQPETTRLDKIGEEMCSLGKFLYTRYVLVTGVFVSNCTFPMTQLFLISACMVMNFCWFVQVHFQPLLVIFLLFTELGTGGGKVMIF
jgi:hypothetical protein